MREACGTAQAWATAGRGCGEGDGNNRGGEGDGDVEDVGTRVAVGDSEGHGWTWMMGGQGRTWGHTEGHRDMDGVGTRRDVGTWMDLGTHRGTNMGMWRDVGTHRGAQMWGHGGTWTLMDMEGDTEGQRWDMDGHGDAYTWMMWRQGRTWGHTEGHMDVDGVGTQWTRGTHRQRDMD